MKKVSRSELSAKTFWVIAFISLVFAGCKKDRFDNTLDSSGGTTPTKIETPKDVALTTATNRTELTKDSIFFYARQVYLWWQEVPAYATFKPREFSSLSAEIFSISRYGLNSATGKPYEFDENEPEEPKYSYLDDITDRNPVAYVPNKRSSVDLEGNGFDFGIQGAIIWTDEVQRKFGILITAVYKDSPAYKSGLERGDIITYIDRELGKYTTSEVNYVNSKIFESGMVHLKGLKRGKTMSDPLFDVTLIKKSYKSRPVYKDSVYTVSSKAVIGYMAYARFSDTTNSQPEFNRVFKRFADNGVTELIIDLRYNGGGYVETAKSLINMIAPASLNKKVMYVEHYNELMQAGKANILAKQPLPGTRATYADIDYSVKENTNYFAKKGPLQNISNVVFIVSEQSASASELVINSLKPFLNVKVVGSKTYGKPVGFFPIRIDKYDVFFSMFETKNSKGEGGYFAGMLPDTGNSEADDDNPFYDFGDLKESSMAAAYNYLTGKGLTLSSKPATISSVRTSKTGATTVFSLDSNAPKVGGAGFNGMIKTRYKLKGN